jgi:hypothetical protein
MTGFQTAGRELKALVHTIFLYSVLIILFSITSYFQISFDILKVLFIFYKVKYVQIISI